MAEPQLDLVEVVRDLVQFGQQQATGKPAAMSRLAGTRILITGASSGIGLAAVERFAREGADLALVARGEAALHQAAAVAHQQGVAAHVFAADVADRAAAAAAVEAAAETLGGLDVVVLNAVAVAFGHFLEVDADDFDRAVAITFTARSTSPGLRCPSCARAPA